MKASLFTILATFALATAAGAQESDRPATEKLYEKAKQAEAEGRRDEAAELIKKAEKLASDPRGPEERKAASEEKLARIRHEIGELHKAGKHEEAERLARRIEAAESGQKPGPAAGHETPRPERLRHLRQAIEHLHAAGMHDMAENLEKHAQRIREEVEAHGRPGPAEGVRRLDGPRSPDGPRPAEGRRPSDSQPQHGPREVEDLRGQIQKLAHELELLRGELKRERSSERGSEPKRE
jgi:hypothetical protein